MSRESPTRNWPIHALFLLYLLAICAIECRISMIRLLYFDELVTLAMAEYKDLPDLGFRLSAGGDNQPAPYYVITRLSESLPIPPHLAARFPSVVGYMLALESIYVLASRRCGFLTGWVAALILQSGTRFYATEARPYALMLGGFALALVSWQDAASRVGRRRAPALVGLLAGMVLATASHFYSVLLFLPLAAGELVRTWRSRRVDWPVWLCIGLAAPIPFACLTLMSSMSSYAQYFWAKAKWLGFISYYLNYLGQVALPVGLASGAFGVVALAMSRPPAEDSPENAEGRALPAHEMVALLALASLPIVANLLGKVVTGVFVGRYVLPAQIGLAVILGYGVTLGVSRRVPSLAVLLLSLAAMFGQEVRLQYRDMKDQIPYFTSEAGRIRGDQERLGLPLKVVDPNLFLQLRYYQPPDGRHSVQFVGGDDLGEKAVGFDTDQRAMQMLKKACGLDVELFSEMASRSFDFLYLGSEGSWLVGAMKGRGARVEPLGDRAGYRFLRITAPPGR